MVSLAVCLAITGARVYSFVVCHQEYPAVPLGEVWENTGTQSIFRWPILPGTAALPSIWLLSVLTRDVMGIYRR